MWYYSIQSLCCNRKYACEFSWSIKKRIYEHRKDISFCVDKNVWVKHNLDTNYNFNCKDSKILGYMYEQWKKACWIWNYF